MDKDTLKVTIRPARVEDAPLLAAAERDIARVPGFLASRPHELVDARFQAKIRDLSNSPRGRYLVAEHDGKIVGHAMLDPLLLEVTQHVVALTMVVHPGFQGRGVGRALLSALITWARATPGVEKIELRVRSGNTAAIALYEKLGFLHEGRMVKRIKVAEGTYLDDLFMGLWVKDQVS